MNEFDIHILVLCIIVFVLLVAVMTALLVVVTSQAMRLIRCGADDEKIKREYEKNNKEHNKLWVIINIIIEVILWLILISIVVFNIITSQNLDKPVGKTPLIKTVDSNSMETKYKDNLYLVENGLDNQISTKDLIFIEQLPEEKDIKLYDIIVYKTPYDDKLVLHRIVDMYEGADGKMVYIFQGDAVPVPDDIPVIYSDMKGIYRDRKIAHIGGFVHFMHSPAGYLCIALAVVMLVAVPIMDAKLEKTKKVRLIEIGVIGDKQNEQEME